MLIPIGHENMAARRWPVTTLALIAINTLVFLLTTGSMSREQPELSKAKSHILLLAALRPELQLKPESQRLVDGFKQSHPEQWKRVQDPFRNELLDAFEVHIKMAEEKDTPKLQAELDDLNDQLSKLSSASIAEQYAFIPAHPRPISYLTANFLHGGVLHLLGNMWFLWLAGFVLEDVWGRWLYSAFYLIAGVAALQFYAWTNLNSITPTLGASGAVAALMGAFLMRFPKMKIEMAWLFFLRMYRFRAAAYWLLPLWLAAEVFYGSLSGTMGGVAHWAHVGGFVFGALAALAIQHSGLEKKASTAIEQKLEWTADADLERANDMMERGMLDDAIAVLKGYVTAKPASIDAWSMLRQIYSRQSNTQGYLEATVKTCELHLKAHEVAAAFQDYADFVDNGGKMPVSTWLELCKGAEEVQEFERAFSEYERLAAAYPADRQALTAQLNAARLCLKKLNRPQDALTLYQKAAASPIPHLDWETLIQSGTKEAKAALGAGRAMAAGAGAGHPSSDDARDLRG